MAVLAYVPPKVVRPVLNRRTSGGSSQGAGGNTRRARSGGNLRGDRYGAYTPAPPPTTPPQPGSPPSPPLYPLGLLGLGLTVGLQALWTWLNQRPKLTRRDLAEGEFLELGELVDVPMQVRFRTYSDSSGLRVFNQPAQPPFITYGDYEVQGLNPGVAVALGAGITSTVTYNYYGENGDPGVQVPRFVIRVANGGEIGAGYVVTGSVRGSNLFGGTAVSGISDISIIANGQTYDFVVEEQGDFAPGMEPSLAAPVIGPAGLVLNPAPATAPPPPLPAAVPNGAPAPAPAPAPGGAPSRAPAPAPGGAPSRAPAPAPATAPPLPGSQPLTPAGPAVTPVAPIVPVTPAEAVIIGSEIVGGPGAAPPPTLPAMAAELGRLERKAELTLDRLGPLANLPDVVDAIADLVELLDSFDPGGSYSIRPACGTDADGNPLPPIEVPIQPGLGLAHVVTARLDAIAELIDHHKQLRQPICKGKPTGQPVTVTAVQLEP